MQIGKLKLIHNKLTQMYEVYEFDFRKIPKGGHGLRITIMTEEEIIKHMLEKKDNI